MKQIQSVRLVWFAAIVLMFNSYVAFASDANKGAELYNLHCASCHGAAGSSFMPAAPNFSFSDSLMQPDGTLLISIQDGKAGMPAYRGVLSNQDTLDTIAYLRTLN